LNVILKMATGRRNESTDVDGAADVELHGYVRSCRETNQVRYLMTVIIEEESQTSQA
jgi:hypothetical protein